MGSRDSESRNADRGSRARIVRSMTASSRRDYTVEFGLSASTLQSWEDGKAGGLTKKGAKKLKEIALKKGVYVTEEYLLEGIGNKPSFIGNNRMEFATDDVDFLFTGGKVIINVRKT